MVKLSATHCSYTNPDYAVQKKYEHSLYEHSLNEHLNTQKFLSTLGIKSSFPHQ